MKDYQLSPRDLWRLRRFSDHLDVRIKQMIGYQMAVDFDYQPLLPLLRHHVNNVGDPYAEPSHVSAKEFEQEVIEFYADMFGAPKNGRWGYVTSGGSESNLYALYVARERLPEAIVYYSEAAHYSIEKALHLLRMQGQKVGVQASDEMDYASLQELLARHKGVPAIVVATVGTTMTEARDNIVQIQKALAGAKVSAHYIHSDAAFAGIYTALLYPEHPFTIAHGADSVSISGHKFIGSPTPCGIIITKRSTRDRIGQTIEYNGALDTTISGSRSGHTPLMMWAAMRRWGTAGFAERAKQSIALADYTERRLTELGWPVRRNPQALTVLFPTPSEAIRRKWQLSTRGEWTHLVCAPGVKKRQIDGFLADLGSKSDAVLESGG